MTTLCCISLTIAARIIAAIGLSTAILMINISLSEFFIRVSDDDFMSNTQMWTIIGLNWTKYMKNLKIHNEVQVTFICLLSYSMLMLIASGFLAMGTVYKKSKYALPWMYIQMFSIGDQMTALIIILTSTNATSYNPIQAQWSSPLACIYLMFSVYFWIIVFSAREQWIRKGEQSSNGDNLNIIISELPRDSNVPKTPSYLAQNNAFFQTITQDVSNKPDNIA